MWDIFSQAHNAGFSQIYLGDEEEWGDFGHIPKWPADQHESHFHLSTKSAATQPAATEQMI
jgi:hypothetical protein